MVTALKATGNVTAEGLLRDGYAVFSRVLPEDLVHALNQEFERRYGHLAMAGADFRGSLRTGDRRYMLTVELSGAFSNASVYANPAVLEILQVVFQGSFILHSFGAVLSLPGARAQRVHRDSQFLFPTELASILPPWAVTLGIPLVNMNSEQGTTEIFPQSHRWLDWKDHSSSLLPDVPAGHAMMWDDRTFHRGTENRATRYRPLLYLTYSKPWWTDAGNFEPEWGSSGPVRQSRIAVGKDFFRNLPKEHRFLFKYVDRP